MKRRTLICLFKDDKKKEFCIRNRNTDFFGSQFQKCLNSIPTGEDYSLVQETILINQFFANSNFEVISIVDAENRYNRDQKAIGSFKDEYIKRMELDGYVWNEDLDKFFEEKYNDTEENNKLRETLINLRNIQTLYEEKGAWLNKEIIRLTKKVDKLSETEKEYNELIKELESKRDVLNSDVESLREKFKSGKAYIKEQEETINNLDSKYEKKFKELSDAYDSKMREFDSNYQSYVNSHNKEIEENIKDKQERLSSLEEELSIRLDEFNKSLDDKRKGFLQEIQPLQEQCDGIKKQIEMLFNERDSIEQIIKDRISGILNESELSSKLDSLINMIKVNKNYYHNTIPQYEIDFLTKMGLQKDVILMKLKDNNIGIRV